MRVLTTRGDAGGRGGRAIFILSIRQRPPTAAERFAYIALRIITRRHARADAPLTPSSFSSRRRRHCLLCILYAIQRTHIALRCSS